MEVIHFLRDLLIVFAVAAGAIFLFHRLRLPAVVGLLVAGMLAGPHGLSLIHQPGHIKLLAEIGIVVLLFTVGLEFSLPKLAGMGRLMALVGAPQVALCLMATVAAVGWHVGGLRLAIFLGMLLAMSSTAVVFKLLTDRGELTSPQGNAAVAALLFQDLLVVVCMVLVPVLAAKGGSGVSLGETLGSGLVVVAGMLFFGRYLVPKLLFYVAQTHNHELFLMVLMLLCLGSSALTGAMGWSLALGAFLAGLALSESDYAAQTLAEMLPFRDALSSLFFVSVGMLLDLQYLVGNLFWVVALVAAIVVLKFLAAATPILLAGYPLRIAALTGVALAQIGEFSFILADRGQALGLLSTDQYQAFLAAAVLSIALTPALIAAGPGLADLLDSLPLPHGWRTGRGMQAPPEQKMALRDHAIIVGYGVNGRNLARVLRAVDIEYVILELNPETVRKASQQGEPIYYGECTRPAVLEHLGIATARLLVIAISDPLSTRRAVQLARRTNPRLHIIVRTRYLSEVSQLRGLGANTIIPEEFETSIEIFAQVLREYEAPDNLILDLIDRVRSDHYEVLRDVKAPTMRIVLPHRHILEKMEIKSCWIRGDSPARGCTVGELNLRAVTGATLVAVRRAGKLHLNPGADLCLLADDIAILMGDGPQTRRAICLLDPARTGVAAKIRDPASARDET